MPDTRPPTKHDGEEGGCRYAVAVGANDPGTTAPVLAADVYQAKPRSRETEWARRQRRNQERAEHVAAHGPACMICGNVPKRGLDQDHDHRTGKTRGWLCARCNRVLWPHATPEWLRAAADYLERAET